MIEAVISDIHGNLEALESVLTHLKTRGIKRVICLGDVVGYGANPVECVDYAMKFDVCLMGNHEWATLHEAVGFNQPARKAVDYTRRLLKPGFFGGSKKKKLWEFLQNLPSKHEEGDYLFVHGSPTNPIEEYILRNEVDEVLGEYTQKIAQAFENTKFAALIGHTHTPGIIVSDAKFIASGLIQTPFKLEEGKKYLINVGSVGQPRDGDWRSCFALLDREANTIEYVRLEYDVDKAMNSILATGKLEEMTGRRLRQGT